MKKDSQYNSQNMCNAKNDESDHFLNINSFCNNYFIISESRTASFLTIIQMNANKSDFINISIL